MNKNLPRRLFSLQNESFLFHFDPFFGSRRTEEEPVRNWSNWDSSVLQKYIHCSFLSMLFYILNQLSVVISRYLLILFRWLTMSIWPAYAWFLSRRNIHDHQFTHYRFICRSNDYASVATRCYEFFLVRARYAIERRSTGRADSSAAAAKWTAACVTVPTIEINVAVNITHNGISTTRTKRGIRETTSSTTNSSGWSTERTDSYRIAQAATGRCGIIHCSRITRIGTSS